MITRRDFIVTSAATASSSLAADLAVAEPKRLPLRALPRVCRLYATPTDDFRLLLSSDSPATPPRLIKPEALEKAFGSGTDLILNQPDHWRMINEGWFSADELYQPTEPNDPALSIWQANYRPEVEAHDLLYDLFRDRVQSRFGVYIPELGLELAEHPSSPRYATARLDSETCLPRLADEIAKRTNWIVIEPGLPLREMEA